MIYIKEFEKIAEKGPEGGCRDRGVPGLRVVAVKIGSEFVNLRGLGRLVLVALVIAGLAGCHPKISKENFDQIKLGMTQEEVQGILGPPNEATGLEIPVFSGTTSKWVQGNTIITVQFVNDKVVAKELSQPPPK